jgi:hypothetical protein
VYVEVEDVRGDAVVSDLVGDVEEDVEEVEAGYEGGREVDVVDD